MTYPTLGYDPAPGDPGAVRGVATALGMVAGDAESITARLHRIGNGAGDTVWRGPAATAFHLLLADVGPDVIRLASAHREAQDALLQYAGTLGQAQDTAWRAESDAARATTERDEQSRTRQRAADEAAQLDRQVWECRRQIAQSQATRLLWAADPAYQAELIRYETQTRGIQHRAESLAAETRGRENTARGAESAAAARIEAARVLGAQAKELRDTAARGTVERLDAAGRQGIAHRNPILRVLSAADDLGRRMVTSPGFEMFMSGLKVLGTALAVLAFAALVVAAFLAAPAAAALAALAGSIGLAASGVGLLALLSTRAARHYGTRTNADVIWASLQVVPGFGPLASLGGKIVTRLLPAAKPLVAAAGRTASSIGQARPVREVIRWIDDAKAQVRPLRHFTPSNLLDLGITGLDLIKDAVPIVRPLPVGPLVTPPPPPQCPAPSTLAAATR